MPDQIVASESLAVGFGETGNGISLCKGEGILRGFCRVPLEYRQQT